jgi:hypothetical protein
MDVHLAARVRRLVASGCSIRSAARELGVSRSAAMRVMSAPAPVIDLADEFDGEADPRDDDEDESEDDDTGGCEPHEYLTPPFDAVGLVDVADPMPVRRRDGKIAGQAPQWHDAKRYTFGQLDLYRWGLRLYEITPDGYESMDAYEAAWRAVEAETEAVTRHAWDSLYALGIAYDDARGQWVQRPQAV